MDEKIRLYKDILKVGNLVKLHKNYDYIHDALDYNRRGFGQVGWNITMQEFKGCEVKIISMNKNVFTFEGHWTTYYECLDTNYKPR